MIRENLKKLILSVLKKFDIDVKRHSNHKPLKYLNKNIHPLSLYYLSNNKEFILNLDLSIGRTSRFYDLSQKSYDPHLFSLKKNLKKVVNYDSYHQKTLLMINKSKEYIKFKNLFEFYGITKNSNSLLNKYPCWSNVLPWENTKIRDKYLSFPKSVKFDRGKNGLKINSNNGIEIMKIDEKFSANSHISQYISLINSIKNYGYRPEKNDNYIEAEILIKEDDYRWKVGGEGNHRALVLTILGYKYVDCKINKIIRYEDAKFWPNVINGLFTTKQAQIIFMRFFDAKPPKSYSQWNDYCKKFHLDEKF